MNTTDDGLLPYLTVRLCDDGSVETRASYAGNDELERLVSPVLALAAGLNTRTTPSLVTDDEVERATDAIIAALGTQAGMLFSQRNANIAARAALAASDRDVLVGALHRIEQDWGHCDQCGKPCEGFTDGCCDRPSWAPDDPVEVARAARQLYT